MQPFELQTLFELARANTVALLMVAGAWLALIVTAFTLGGARWRLARPLALLASILSTVSALVTVPGISKTSFDWTALLLIALAFGIITFAFAWPAAATLMRERN